MKNKVNVLIAADHSLFRLGLKEALTEMENVSHVLDAANGKEAIALIERQPVDVLLLDLKMPVMNGFEVCRYLATDFRHIKVILLSMYVNAETAESYLRQTGAHACLPKEVSIDELEETLAAVMATEECKLFPRPERGTAPFNLSLGELEVLRLMAKGYGSKEIATELKIGIRAVDARRENVYEKLGARNTAQAIHIATNYFLI